MLVYALGEHAVLGSTGMDPSMSYPANYYDNASCRSCTTTLKREEVYANRYDGLEHSRLVPRKRRSES